MDTRLLRKKFVVFKLIGVVGEFYKKVVLFYNSGNCVILKIIGFLVDFAIRKGSRGNVISNKRTDI